jgi:choline-phosphate cytidylyltransferase
MKKVITYGTFDLLHYGHRRLLERAKALGDYLIVGVTSDDFDKQRGKINVRQSLMERIEGVRATGLADEIIVEEYEGQKIDDILRYNIDIFVEGSDWKGKFDFLKSYCQVVYLDRTEGISSSDIRTDQQKVRLGILGNSGLAGKFSHACSLVNGAEISALCTSSLALKEDFQNKEKILVTEDRKALYESCDAVYILTPPDQHARDIQEALEAGKHVLCESPVTISRDQYDRLSTLSREKDLVLMDGIKTAFATAFNRLLLLIKSGRIGKVVSIDVTCTSMENLLKTQGDISEAMNSMCAWGPTALLPVFQILGDDYRSCQIVSYPYKDKNWDGFSKIDFIYPDAVASVKIGKAIKAEGELIIAGTEGYLYVPAPWWKTEYFEVRYENPEKNRRFFYQLEGEGIPYEIVNFIKAIHGENHTKYLNSRVTRGICRIMDDFYTGRHRIDIGSVNGLMNDERR